MSAEETTEPSEHEFLLHDINSAQARATKSTYLEAKKELAEETYPLMASMAEHFGERLERLEAAVDAILNESESFIQPQLAGQIFATLDLGKALADMVTNIQSFDDVTVKRIRQSAAAYLTAYEMTTEAVSEVASPPDAMDDDNDIDEDEEAEQVEDTETAEADAGEEE